MQHVTIVFQRQRSYLRSSMRILCLALFALLGAGYQSSPKAAAGPQPIHGYVYARINSDFSAVALPAGASVAVPDIVVAAQNVATGLLSKFTSTRILIWIIFAHRHSRRAAITFVSVAPDIRVVATHKSSR